VGVRICMDVQRCVSCVGVRICMDVQRCAGLHRYVVRLFSHFQAWLILTPRTPFGTHIVMVSERPGG
jgi:hypothetical protein